MMVIIRENRFPLFIWHCSNLEPPIVPNHSLHWLGLLVTHVSSDSTQSRPIFIFAKPWKTIILTSFNSLQSLRIKMNTKIVESRKVFLNFHCGQERFVWRGQASLAALWVDGADSTSTQAPSRFSVHDIVLLIRPCLWQITQNKATAHFIAAW